MQSVSKRKSGCNTWYINKFNKLFNIRAASDEPKYLRINNMNLCDSSVISTMGLSTPVQPSASVEQLVTAFKRRGHFDTLRKSTLSSFQSCVRSHRYNLTFDRARVKNWSQNFVKSCGRRLKKIQISSTETVRKVRY